MSYPTHLPGKPALVAVKTLATLPIGSFLENLVVRHDNTLLFSNMTGGAIYFLDPKHEDPQSTLTLLHDYNIPLPSDPVTSTKEFEVEGTEASPYGSGRVAEAIIEHPSIQDLFYTFSGIHGQRNTWSIYTIDLRHYPSSSPVITKIADVPDATWLNGGTIIPVPTPTLLMAEASQGRIISYELTGDKGVQIWADDAELGDINGSKIASAWPQVNGVRYYNNYVFATVSDQGHMVRFTVDSTTGGVISGSKQIVVKSLVGDDMAFNTHGDAYVATNPHQSVVKFVGLGNGAVFNAEEGDTRIRVVGGSEVAETAGPTAVVLGRGEDEGSLFVTTTGGMVVPVDGVLGVARIVRADVGRD